MQVFICGDKLLKIFWEVESFLGLISLCCVCFSAFVIFVVQRLIYLNQADLSVA